MTAAARPDLRERVLSRVVIDLAGHPSVDGAPCWDWSRGKNAEGYGRLRIRNLTYQAPRVAWELLRGPLPDLVQLDHLCGNRACCNPAHLEPSPGRLARGETSAEQAARRLARARQRHSRCPAGHLFTEASTFLRSNGSRRCRECHNKGQREYRARKAAS